MSLLDPNRVASISGYGQSESVDGYIFRPTNINEIAAVFELARRQGRQVVLRGAGRSYGDAALGREAIVLDIQRMNRVLNYDPASGIIEVEAGATIEDLWRTGIEDGWWPPVVSGTAFPTIAGALAMNIHGKNAFRAGPIGEHVLSVDVMTPKGALLTVKPDDPLFRAIISSAGLLGCICGATIQLKKVHSGDLRVLPISVPDWKSQFEIFEQYQDDADYLVSWVDSFPGGKKAGRGVIHAARYTDEGKNPQSLRLEHQELSDMILGFLPKSVTWRFLRPLANRFGMRKLNWAKHRSAKLLGNGKPHPQSLVAFSFLLDSVPNWRLAYQPGGFIQYQSFVPKETARVVFDELLARARAEKLEPLLAVLKRHRADRFLFSHGVDGYSLALDFRVTGRNRERLWALCHRMNDMVLEAGGRFYFAKDSTLRPSDAARFLGEETLREFRAWKAELDPEGLLTSGLAERLELFAARPGPNPR